MISIRSVFSSHKEKLIDAFGIAAREFKRFEVVIEPGRAFSDPHILYLIQYRTYISMLSDLEILDDKFCFLVQTDEWQLITAPEEGYVCAAYINLPFEKCINILSRAQAADSQSEAAVNRYTAAFLGDIIDGHIIDNDEIIATLRSAKIRLKKHLSIVVISKRNMDHSMRVASVQDFAACFPGCLATYHHGDIIIMTQKNNYSDKTISNNEKLINTLRYNKAIAVQSAYTQWVTSIRPSYIHAKISIPYILRSKDKDQDFFLADKYLYEQLVEMCAKYAKDFFCGDVHYAVSPAAIILESEGEKDNDDYLGIVAEYLDCERNLSLTAEKLFCHRSTLKAKLDKIDSLLKGYSLKDLDDPHFRYGLRLSISILRYMHDVMKRESSYSIKELVPSTAEQIRTGDY